MHLVGASRCTNTHLVLCSVVKLTLRERTRKFAQALRNEMITQSQKHDALQID